MKSQIKKISFAVVLLLFCACSNSNSSQAGNNQEATLFSQRESFSNTIAAKLFRKYYHYDIPSKEEILKDEYETIEDLIKNLYPNRWKTVIANSKKDVEEAEKIAKTKFYRSKDITRCKSLERAVRLPTPLPATDPSAWRTCRLLRLSDTA